MKLIRHVPLIEVIHLVIPPPIPQKSPCVLILSGGLDSTTLFYQLIAASWQVHALSFHYGQKHRKELECAQFHCERMAVPHVIVDLRALTAVGIFGANALTSATLIPEGGYTDQSMAATVVPNRNMVMLSVAIAHAITINAAYVFYGAHAGDHAIYPDCRPDFVTRMQAVAAICHYVPIRIEAPYLHWTKAQIVAEGVRAEVPYDHTWTCYVGGEMPCGKCGSCTERLEAFAANHIKDPLQYNGE